MSAEQRPPRFWTLTLKAGLVAKFPILSASPTEAERNVPPREEVLARPAAFLHFLGQWKGVDIVGSF